MNLKKAKVYFHKLLAGILEKTGDGFTFTYDHDYLKNISAQPISITLPLKDEAFKSRILFPFFKGLIPEGWLFNINAHNLKIDPADDFAMLINTAKECIGAVSILPYEEDL